MDYEFEITPFYLYPIEEKYMDKLFINRDMELEIIRSVLDTTYEEFSEICSIVGDVGEGKSSMLNYAKKMAKEKDYDVGYTNRQEDLEDANKMAKNNEIVILDDTDRLCDEEVKDFYREAEDFVQDCKVVIFTDTNERSHETLKERDFMVSEEITLPKFQDPSELGELLKKRMENCLTSDDSFEFPFSEKALEMAFTRSNGNLRSFMKYTENAWNLRGEKENIDGEVMKKGISMADRKTIDRLDMNSLKILWITTDAQLNKGYVGEITGLDSVRLDKKIEGPLSELIESTKTRNGIRITSIYTEVPKGEEILRDMYSNMGIDTNELD